MEEKLRRNLQLSLSSIRSWDLMQLYILCYLLLWSGQNVAVVIHGTFSSSLDLTANFSPGLKLDSLVTTALSCNRIFAKFVRQPREAIRVSGVGPGVHRRSP